MLKVDAVLFEHAEHSPPESHLGVHHGLLNIDGTETLLARDACDGVAGLAAGALHDQSALVLGAVGVADVDGNALLAHRENGILVEHAGAHVGQLPQLLICNGFDYFRILYDARIGHQHAGDVGPVLVHVGVNGFGHNGAGDVGAAPGEGLDAAVVFGPVEARDHGPLYIGKAFGQLMVRVLGLQVAVVVEEDNLRGVDEFIV